MEREREKEERELGVELEQQDSQQEQQQHRFTWRRPSFVSKHTTRSASHDEDPVNEISLREVEPVNVHVHDLSLSVDISPNPAIAWAQALTGKKGSKSSGNKFKQILNEVSAEMPSGSLTAIIGGSGSGKTSMLNVMSNRMRGSRLKTSGSVTYNDRDLRAGVASAYVMQQDVLIPTLTVRETLLYSADLRLPPPTTAEERRKIVEEVILELGLKECANTRIGNHVHKGCSGGEKRRTSIGVQLLANPSVLFLDEPTTGLDATSAFQLVRTLKHLATKGRTVITTIHQPRSEIWTLFDRLVLLTRGSAVYSGNADECLPYFTNLGFPLPPFVNPAEHLIDVAAVDTRSTELEETSLARVEQLKLSWAKKVSESSLSEEQASTPSRPTSKRALANLSASRSALLRQISVLTRRTFKVTLRDPMGVAGSLVESIGMAIITGWIFFALDGSLAGIRSRQGALYIAAALQGYLVLLYEIYRLTSDIELFDRERGEGVVGVTAFLVSRRLARFPMEDVPVPLIFSIIFYFMAGFRPVAGVFFTFFGVTLLSQYIAVTFAMTCIAVSRNFAGASLVANMGYTLQSFACGYFVQSSTIPVYVRWLKWAAYVFYAFGALCSNEFAGQFYDCPSPGGASDPACLQYTGEFILDSLALPDNWLVIPICACLAFAVAFYVGAGLLLQYWKVEMSISKARPTETDDSAGKEKMAVKSNHPELRTVDIGLDKYSLDIDKRNMIGKKAKTLSILKPVTANFQFGHLNVIMGPSGSGKTSLLNAMARRLHNSTSTKYRSSGNLLYNGAIPSASVVRSVTCYVCQDDDALLPSLTVRETLRFAAGLRLPPHMSRREKNERAEQVLMKMGLKDCADNLIGSDLVKGISGGEKRRVTIAVQILTDPRVLLLDEPTSGLDAFTASSIVDVLRGLAEEGRTLILTIHQSRSDLFKHFGNVLLLARGGYPVYSGKGDGMLPHFASLGYDCPQTTNPADFALDLITVDLQHAKREAVSREKVRTIIEGWQSDSLVLAENTKISTPAELGGMKRKMTPFHIAYPLLVHRGIINFRRQPELILGRIMQVVGFGIVLALFFAPLKNDYYSVQTRLGFVQEVTALYFVGMLQNIAVYPKEKDVFYREHDDRVYSVEAFFLQYTTNEIPFEVISGLIFAVLADIAPGLPRTPELFFLMAFNCFCIINTGESIGIMFGTLFAHTGFAVNVTSVFLSIATLMAGVMSLNVPSFLQALNRLSPLKYVVGNLAPYSLRDQLFTCTDAQRLPNGSCPVNNGLEVLELYNLNTDAPMNVMALGVATIIYRVLAYLLLKAKRTHFTFGRKKMIA
ncbi:MAG: hypothetical protein M4579_005693 [Chaenotheca gracillima]|nr:MAG: hypothetical protein M4579_005693 [Chaenotheca gracillima]